MYNNFKVLYTNMLNIGVVLNETNTDVRMYI